MKNSPTTFRVAGRNVRYITATLGGLAAVTLAGNNPAAFADPPVTMAPPIGYSTSNLSGPEVFQWTEIPRNERVPLDHAIFDRSGYQLYDKAGETIVVPFKDQNLYVMKFAVSPDNSLYFVNEDGTPVLYVPRHGYLENNAVSGAKWYPFSEEFVPTQPVFLGVAPSYTEFIDVEWHPRTVVYGGYYCSRSYIEGGFFRPTFGLTFIIGDERYHRWHELHDYCVVHPAPYHNRYSVDHTYVFVRPAYSGNHEFHGYSGYRENHERYSHEEREHEFHGFGGNRPVYRPEIHEERRDNRDAPRDNHEERRDTHWVKPVPVQITHTDNYRPSFHGTDRYDGGGIHPQITDHANRPVEVRNAGRDNGRDNGRDSGRDSGRDHVFFGTGGRVPKGDTVFHGTGGRDSKTDTTFRGTDGRQSHAEQRNDQKGDQKSDHHNESHGDRHGN